MMMAKIQLDEDGCCSTMAAWTCYDSRSSRRLPVARAAALAQARREDVWQGGLRNSGGRYLDGVGHKFSYRASRGRQIVKGQGYGKTTNSCGGRWIYHRAAAN
jgi:hypothetical protein